MDSETQPNPKSDWKSTAFAFLVCAALMGGMAVFSKLTNPQVDVLGYLYITLALAAGLVLFLVITLKVITILSLLASIIFLVISFFTKEHNPQLSSMSFLSAFVALAGAVVPTLFSRTQTFLYDRGFRGTGVYIDGSANSGWSDSGWGGGDCDGGDCGG